MVPRSDLPGAVALNSMGFNIARSVGPAIGGFVVAAAGAFGAFAVNAVSYLGLIVVLARWRPDTPPRVLPPESLGSAMAAGIRYVAMSPKIGVVLLRGDGVRSGGDRDPGADAAGRAGSRRGGPLTYGLLLGAFGIGRRLRRLRQRAAARDPSTWRLSFASASSASPSARSARV